MTIKTLSHSEPSELLREQIDVALRRAAQFENDCPARLQEAIEYCLLAPGKRLRPQLVLLSARACGAEITDAMPAAVAVEMVHTYSLVHDDLPAIDDDDLRRGRPTCHKRFDEATAILVGDALLARAFEILATEILPPATASNCCAELGQAAGATALVGGQADDLDSGFGNRSQQQLESIHRRKTGALFSVSMRLGAMIGNATAEQLQALDDYGRHLGLAFQVIDDLLDVSGSEDEMGKRLNKDSRQGKATYPAVLGLQASRDYATSLIEQACAALDTFGESATALRDLALFVGRRNS